MGPFLQKHYIKEKYSIITSTFGPTVLVQWPNSHLPLSPSVALWLWLTAHCDSRWQLPVTMGDSSPWLWVTAHHNGGWQLTVSLGDGSLGHTSVLPILRFKLTAAKMHLQYTAILGGGRNISSMPSSSRKGRKPENQASVSKEKTYGNTPGILHLFNKYWRRAYLSQALL